MSQWLASHEISVREIDQIVEDQRWLSADTTGWIYLENNNENRLGIKIGIHRQISEKWTLKRRVVDSYSKDAF